MNWRKIVAREWLVLLGCAIAGVVIAVNVDATDEQLLPIIWTIYAAVQGVRATIWAIKTVRRKESAE